MTIYNINFRGTLEANPATWSAIESFTLGATGTLLNDAGGDDGVTYEVMSGYTGKTGATAYGDTDLYGFPVGVWRNVFYASAGTGSTAVKGLTEGDTYTLSVIGHANSDLRDTDFIVDGVTERYDNTNTSAERAAPVVFTGSISASGTLLIDQEIVSSFSYINGAILEVTPAATGPTTRDITLNGEATHEVIQTMTATANTTVGESIFGTGIIVVEDDMQAYVPKTANGMNITWAADGTFTTDADQTETITVAYFSPSTEEWSCLALTIRASSIISSTFFGFDFPNFQFPILDNTH